MHGHMQAQITIVKWRVERCVWSKDNIFRILIAVSFGKELDKHAYTIQLSFLNFSLTNK